MSGRSQSDVGFFGGFWRTQNKQRKLLMVQVCLSGRSAVYVVGIFGRFYCRYT